MRRGVPTHWRGLAAEDIAARDYAARGGTIIAERWRCPEGEIDLIVRLGDLIVFVEVKARKGHDAAAAAISDRQWRRIGAAASRYLAEHTDGQTACRFDAVLVDAMGEAECIENAARFDEW